MGGTLIGQCVALGIVGFTRMLTGARVVWHSGEASSAQRVYFGNHQSHGDFVLIWSALPRAMRLRTRPVAGADYWLAGGVRRYISQSVINAVLIERATGSRQSDPIAVLCDAVDAGHSLIVFPEGTRNTGDERLLPFKSGIYRLAQARPHLELVPVWVENIGRVMPKGEILPLPLLCTAHIGAPLRLIEGEDKQSFLDRARAALLDLAPAPLQ